MRDCECCHCRRGMSAVMVLLWVLAAMAFTAHVVQSIETKVDRHHPEVPSDGD